MTSRLVGSPRSFVPGLALALILSACGSGPGPGSTGPAPEPSASVERFLEAVGNGDLESMGRIFGTVDGSHLARSERSFRCGLRRFGSFFRLAGRCPSPQEVELRMDALAQVLDHQSFQVTGEDQVAGREDPTVQVGVTLVQNGQEIPNVAFVVVQASEGVWYLSEIDVEGVTGGAS